MDEMNNVMMENETSTEVVPVETLVPVTGEEPACNNDCESSAGVSFGTIVKVGARRGHCCEVWRPSGEEGIQAHQGRDGFEEGKEERSH